MSSLQRFHQQVLQPDGWQTSPPDTTHAVNIQPTSMPVTSTSSPISGIEGITTTAPFINHATSTSDTYVYPLSTCSASELSLPMMEHLSRLTSSSSFNLCSLQMTLLLIICPIIIIYLFIHIRHILKQHHIIPSITQTFPPTSILTIVRSSASRWQNIAILICFGITVAMYIQKFTLSYQALEMIALTCYVLCWMMMICVCVVHHMTYSRSGITHRIPILPLIILDIIAYIQWSSITGHPHSIWYALSIIHAILITFITFANGYLTRYHMSTPRVPYYLDELTSVAPIFITCYLHDESDSHVHQFLKNLTQHHHVIHPRLKLLIFLDNTTNSSTFRAIINYLALDTRSPSSSHGCDMYIGSYHGMDIQLYITRDTSIIQGDKNQHLLAMHVVSEVVATHFPEYSNSAMVMSLHGSHPITLPSLAMMERHLILDPACACVTATCHPHMSHMLSSSIGYAPVDMTCALYRLNAWLYVASHMQQHDHHLISSIITSYGWQGRLMSMLWRCGYTTRMIIIDEKIPIHTSILDEIHNNSHHISGAYVTWLNILFHDSPLITLRPRILLYLWYLKRFIITTMIFVCFSMALSYIMTYINIDTYVITSAVLCYLFIFTLTCSNRTPHHMKLWMHIHLVGVTSVLYASCITFIIHRIQQHQYVYIIPPILSLLMIVPCMIHHGISYGMNMIWKGILYLPITLLATCHALSNIDERSTSTSTSHHKLPYVRAHPGRASFDHHIIIPSLHPFFSKIAIVVYTFLLNGLILYLCAIITSYQHISFIGFSVLFIWSVMMMVWQLSLMGWRKKRTHSNHTRMLDGDEHHHTQRQPLLHPVPAFIA